MNENEIALMIYSEYRKNGHWIYVSFEEYLKGMRKEDFINKKKIKNGRR